MQYRRVLLGRERDAEAARRLHRVLLQALDGLWRVDAGQQIVYRRAQGVHVGEGPLVRVQILLHGREAALVHDREALGGGRARRAEVYELERAVPRPHDVVRGYVAVYKPALVHPLEVAQQRPEPGQQQLRRDAPAELGGLFVERHAVYELHDQIGRAPVLKGAQRPHDGGQLERGEHPRLLAEALKPQLILGLEPGLGRDAPVGHADGHLHGHELLDRHAHVPLQLLRAVGYAEAALAEHALDTAASRGRVQDLSLGQAGAKAPLARRHITCLPCSRR